MIRLCTGYPVHNNQTSAGSLFARPRWKKPKSTSQQKLARHLDIVKPKQKSSDFTTLKENPKADLSNGFYCGKFIFSTHLIKLNHFLCFNRAPPTNRRRSEYTPSNSSVRRIISRLMLS